MTTHEKFQSRLSLPHRLLRDNRGLSTVEYVIVLVLIAAIAMAAWKKFGGDVAKKLKDANSELNEQVKIKK